MIMEGRGGGMEGGKEGRREGGKGKGMGKGREGKEALVVVTTYFGWMQYKRV